MKKNMLMVLLTIFAVAGVLNVEAFCGCKAPVPKKTCPVKAKCARVSKCTKCGDRNVDDVRANIDEEDMSEDIDNEDIDAE